MESPIQNVIYIPDWIFWNVMGAAKNLWRCRKF